MTRKLVSLAVTAALAGAAAIAPQPAFAQSAEIEALKAQLAALSAKIEQLEKSQAQTKKVAEETQATADKTADVVAQATHRAVFRRRPALPQRIVRRPIRRPRPRPRPHPCAPQRQLPRERHDYRPDRSFVGQRRSAFGQPDASTARTRASRSHSTSPMSPGRRTRNGRSRPASSVTPGCAAAACSTTTT